jgi:hypothetical protein
LHQNRFNEFLDLLAGVEDLRFNLHPWLRSQVAVGWAAKFLVDQRQQSTEPLFVASPPVPKEQNLALLRIGRGDVVTLA